jgi:uncharacterized tellurite resistance protein B-like protein
MPLIMAFFVAMLLALIVYNVFNRIPRLPRTGRDWGAAGSNDPRIAVAAMLYMVATEDGRLTAENEGRILARLSSTVGLGPDLARTCLTGGKRLARRLSGDLNARLHQLLAPIERQCSPEEKQEVIGMLKEIAGPSAERLGPVRDGIGRLSSSLLHG